MPKLPLKFDAQGLVPTIVQDHVTGEIRMFAFATDAAVRKTLDTGHATFWSRSRGELWQKGRISGELTPVVRVLADCDADCLIYSSDPHAASCHSGAPSCFFQAVHGERLSVASEQPQMVLASVEAAIDSSKKSTAGANPSDRTLDDGVAGIAGRVRDHAGQFARALEAENDDRVVLEAADTLLQVLVGVRARSIAVRRVLVELARRVGAMRPGAKG
jgi:phosphoribosyl-AMP cyclohydrolase / phosphoribosyl-ATP pyrophosphohydrolase